MADVALGIDTPEPVESLYHWYVNEPVPPEGVAVSTIDCPWSSVEDDGDTTNVGV